MTRGTHITEEQCAEIRRLKARGRWDRLIAKQMDISRPAVYYHTSGRCSHPPPPDDLLADAEESGPAVARNEEQVANATDTETE